MTDQTPDKFRELDELRGQLAFYREKQTPSLTLFFRHKSDGFAHLLRDPDKGRPSLSCSATCYVSTIRAGLENGKSGFLNNVVLPSAAIRAIIARDWNSALLQSNNAFSVAFAIEAIAEIAISAIANDLDTSGVIAAILDDVSDAGELNQKLANGYHWLLRELSQGVPCGTWHPPAVYPVRPAHDPGRIAMGGYPPSAYLTQLAWRAIQVFNKLVATPKFAHIAPKLNTAEHLEQLALARKNISSFARGELHRQICLHAGMSKFADPFQLAYSIILDRMTSDPEELSADHQLIVDLGFRHFFDAQLEDGSWPRSQVLFHYPGVGNAYCYEYELFAQLLEPEGLDLACLNYIDKFAKAVAFAHRTRSLDKGAPTWSSGHHPQTTAAESWATACVYQAFFKINRLASEKSRRLLFGEVGAVYPEGLIKGEIFAPRFLDSSISVEGLMPTRRSLVEVLKYCIVNPIRESANRVELGYPFPKDLPTCLLLFGPPGTSKTQLAKEIAAYLGWPSLTIDTSYFLRNGNENIQSQADRVFHMLSQADQLVVLLDEFDEMVRERSNASESSSRFLTTSMLPKLAQLNNDRRIVFIVATNFIQSFDLAIRRGGRFDAIVQVMPPTFEAKKKQWPDQLNDSALERVRITKVQIEDLTFLETVQLVDDIKANLPATVNLEKRHIDGCTLSTVETNARPWKEACGQQEKYIRIPNIGSLDQVRNSHPVVKEVSAPIQY